MQSRLWDMDIGDELPTWIYKYRVMSVRHLMELQADFEKIDAEGKVSNNPVFRSYIAEKQHHIPESFPEAKSVIVLAVFTPLMTVDFHYQGKIHEILLSHYYDDGIAEDQLKATILNKIVGSNRYRVENAKMHVLLKRLAVSD